MLKETLEKMFIEKEIPRKTGRFSDYEKGKAMIKKMNLPLSSYNTALDILKKWIGL